MKIAEFSYHELKRVWVSSEARYVDRDKEDMFKLIIPHMLAYRDKDLTNFLRPYVLNPIDNVSLKEAVSWIEDREARLWVTINFYNPISKYGDIFESPTIEIIGVDDNILDIIWNLSQRKSRRFPPFATVRIDLE